MQLNKPNIQLENPIFSYFLKKISVQRYYIFNLNYVEMFFFQMRDVECVMSTPPPLEFLSRFVTISLTPTPPLGCVTSFLNGL